MEIGIDSFAARFTENSIQSLEDVDAIHQLLERIKYADEQGVDSFGIGEHHRKGFLDSAPPVILSAAAGQTKQIRLTSAVTVLGADDPVRVFQNFATLDLISKGRTEMVVGRGSSIEAFPLFGYSLNDYDELFEEKLGLLLNIRKNEFVTWSGKFRPAISNLPVYPRPLQDPLPVWIGVGGTPQSFIRAGVLGLPLMVAIIGGETKRFRPLIDLYYKAGEKAGHKREDLKVGLHSLGYVAETSEKARSEFAPGYIKAMTKAGRERGWPPTTMESFKAQVTDEGALIVGGPEEVAEKILHHSKALDGISRVTFQMDVAELAHDKLMNAIELIGNKVKALVNVNTD
jgi:probable LLM family oxidoreductase